MRMIYVRYIEVSKDVTDTGEEIERSVNALSSFRSNIGHRNS